MIILGKVRPFLRRPTEAHPQDLIIAPGAGWGFVVGKTASCAAMALTVGAYVWPPAAHPIAAASVVVVTAVNYTGVQKSARLTRVIVAAVLAVLAALVVTALASPVTDFDRLRTLDVADTTVGGVLQAAGLLFFAFAGYARIATLGEEVRDPARTIPRAIPLALGIALSVYAAVAVTALTVLGPDHLAAAVAPLADVARAAGQSRLVPVVQAGAALAALGSLLSLLLGVSRTTLAMARDHHLPPALAAVHPRFQVPHRAELLIGAVVTVVAACADLRGAIGFSSFAVLVYYAIANVSASTLRPAEHRLPRGIPILGLLGCVALAAALPRTSVLSGAAVLGAGAAVYWVRGVGRRRCPFPVNLGHNAASDLRCPRLNENPSVGFLIQSGASRVRLVGSYAILGGPTACRSAIALSRNAETGAGRGEEIRGESMRP